MFLKNSSNSNSIRHSVKFEGFHFASTNMAILPLVVVRRRIASESPKSDSDCSINTFVSSI